MPKHLKIIGILVVIISIFSLIKSKVIVPLVSIHNASIQMTNHYNQVVQDQFTSWDNYYLEFDDQVQNTLITKETFLEVTNIILLLNS